MFARATHHAAYFSRPAIALSLSLLTAPLLHAQGSASLGNGLSAGAIARGGSTVTASGALDAMEGNPAGLAAASNRALEFSAVGLYAGGSFTNVSNRNAKLTGVAAAMPYGSFVAPIRKSPWVAAAAFTPEILMRANWHYSDTPGTAGVTYGYQQQETQIIALRSALGIARTFGPRLSAGATLGIVYNQNDLNAPYIFQQEPHVAGLKVLLKLKTRGYGWNGGGGIQWHPRPSLNVGLAWKSGTTIRTQGDANGSASALFNALGVTADPTFHYHVQVMNHLPQSFNAGLSWQTKHQIRLAFQGDFTAWGQAFQQLPISLTGGTNAVINSVVGNNNFKDAVPLHWNNQATFHVGVERPVSESLTLRGGYSFATNPVPSATLTPLTAAIMQNALATGAGYSHGRWIYDAAYQAQLPATQHVAQSGLQAGEYSNSFVRVWTQSVTFSGRVRF